MDTEMDKFTPVGQPEEHPATKKFRNREESLEQSKIFSFKDAIVNDSSGYKRKIPTRIPVKVNDDEVIHSIKDGIGAVRFLDPVQQRMKDAMGYSVVVNPLGRTVADSVLKNKLAVLWQPKGELEIRDQVNGHYVIRLTSEDDYNNAILNGPWTYGRTPQMSFTETVRLKLYWNTTYTTEPDGTITVQRDAPDGYLIIDRMLDFSELVDKVCSVMEVDREGLYIDFSLEWTERSGKRSRVHINDDNTVRFIYLCADKWPELYPENVERTGHVYASTSGQDIGASISGGRTVEDNEDGDEDGDEDEDKDENADEDEDEDGVGVESSDDEYVPSDEDSDDDTDFESSSSVPYVFDDISGWDKTLEEVDCDGIKMWDGNPLTLGLDIHFANKPEAQAAVGEWNLVHGRTFRVKTSSKRTWYVECETCGPKYPKERLHGYDCLWKARVSLQKATDTWKMVVWSDSHNCLGANKRNESRNVTSSMIARLVAQNVRKHPDFAVAQIQIEVLKRYQVECSYKKAWHGRRKALEALYEARKKSLRQKVNRFSKRNQKYEVVTIAPDNQPWKAEEKQVVLYANRECTCGRWHTFRFPCSHALRVARELGDDPFPLFDPCYTMHQWYQQFSGEFNPIMEPWPKATWQIRPDDTKLVHHAGRGRKRVNRKKGVMDYTRQFGLQRLQTCSLCKLQSHNARACPYARVCARCGSLDHDAVGCSFSHPPADRTAIDKLYDPYGIRGVPNINSDDDDDAMSKSSLAASAKAITGYVILLQVTVKYVTDPTDSENARGFHGSAETLRLMATFMEDVRSLSIIGQRTFDADSFGYDRLGEIAQVAERAWSVNATNVVRHDLDRHVEVNDILSQELAPVDPAQQHPPSRPPRHSRRSQRGRGGQETIISSQPHQSSQHEQSHIPFTSGSSHQSPHQSPLHSRQHSAHQSPHHSSHQSPHHSSPTQQAFYRPIMSPQHQQSNFAFTQFSSPQTSQRQFGDSFIDFSGFQQSSLDGQSIHYTSNFLSSMFEGVAGQHQADDPAEGERESQGEDEAEDEAEDADQDDQFEGQGYQRHEEQGSSQTLGTPPLAVSKGQRVTKEPDRLTYSLFRAKKPKKK
ncbi:OLC1v1015983C1 [Oldenlandia corymbosa var. corymbosa]|uniref:OLC1v1015983C1 n=1 Tax=Oldenlandia corymbosa var. corymbosa TaxID=529605 RepID=A0AAV1E4H1_OLDCO|nr:OLC1v1015983C1 [Oldenlandia corymbosa var. corymbosa]